ncbi:MAG: hypothetical protein HQL82_05610 [Magnetococcales bacterium]|nr:hypothetical protein [Magnetococcales bacterium]
MRVTQSMMYRATATSLQAQYQEVAKVQEQSNSGQRVNTLSEDPAAAYRNMLLSSELSSVESLKRTTDIAVERFIMAEDSIQVMHDKFLDAQDLILKMGTSLQQGLPEVMKAASREVLAQYEDVMRYANAELDGVPIFSGGKTRNPFNGKDFLATSVRMRSGDEGGFLATTEGDYTAAVTGVPDQVPLGVKITYRTTDSDGTALATAQYEVNVNGDSTTVDATGTPQTITVATGVEFTVNASATPGDGDAFYFEVVPSYQGGEADRLVKVSDTRNLAGNVTGAELIEGKNPPGRGVNLLAALAGLRGALMRSDSEEVNAWLGTVQEGRAQASDLQAITGIRAVQAESIRSTLEDDQLTLENTKAKNIEADVFDVLSRLEQATQALQVMTVSERQVLNTSLLDFIR